MSDAISGAIDQVKVRLLPSGQMDANNAAKYVNRAPKTLAMWRVNGIGPAWTKVGGRVFYNKKVLDFYMLGEAAA